MPPKSRRAVFAQAIGLLCYMGGFFALFTVAIGAILAFQANELSSLPMEMAVYLLIGIILTVVGRVIIYRFGGNHPSATGWLGAPSHQEPDQNALEQLGYTMPPEEDDTQVSAPDVVICSECGTKNDVEYSYCGQCSARLR